VRPLTLSLRLRLTLLCCAVSLLMLIGLELVTLVVLSAQLDQSIDRELALAAAQYRQRLAATAGQDLGQRTAAAVRSDPAGSGTAAVYFVRLADGQVVTNTSDDGLRRTIRGVVARPGRPVTVRDRVHGDLRVAVIPIEQAGSPAGELRVALSLAGVEATVGGLVTPLLAVDVALVALGAALAYLVIGGGLSPVREITETAAGISGGDLSRRIGYRGPSDEVGRLAETFDEMLGRLETGFQQRQAFYSLASHELRTPLTIVRGHLDVLRRVERPSREELRETLDVVLDELGRLTAEVDDMLLLGRMLLGQPGRLDEVDAGSLLTEVLRRARGLAARDWRLEVSGPASIRADPEQLTRALLNLVTNAVRHTAEGDRVRLACGVSGGWARLEVADAGAGIAAADLAHVFDPWYRAASRDGSVGGLGLTIVREVAHAHGGEVEVESHEGVGATFTIRVPLSAG